MGVGSKYSWTDISGLGFRRDGQNGNCYIASGLGCKVFQAMKESKLRWKLRTVGVTWGFLLFLDDFFRGSILGVINYKGILGV